MHRQEKKSQNGKLNALRELATQDLNHLVDQNLGNALPAQLMEHLVRIQITLIDLMEAMIEPEEPE